MSLLLGLVSALAPILLKALELLLAGQKTVHVVEEVEVISNAAVNAGDALDALKSGTF